MRNKEIVNFVLFIFLIIFGGSTRADYVTLDGKPVTQGEMLITSNSMDRFILKRTDVEVEITGVVALFGYLNRWKDSMGTEMENGAIESGEKWLSKEGWTPGKHRY